MVDFISRNSCFLCIYYTRGFLADIIILPRPFHISSSLSIYVYITLYFVLYAPSLLSFFSHFPTLCSFPNTRRFYPHHFPTARRSFHAILLCPSLSFPIAILFSLLVVPHCPRLPLCLLPSRTRHSLRAISSTLPLALAVSLSLLRSFIA